MALCLFVLSILTAQAWLKLYDEPVRKWLKQKLFKKRSSYPKLIIIVCSLICKQETVERGSVARQQPDELPCQDGGQQ